MLSDEEWALEAYQAEVLEWAVLYHGIHNRCHTNKCHHHGFRVNLHNKDIDK